MSRILREGRMFSRQIVQITMTILILTGLSACGDNTSSESSSEMIGNIAIESSPGAEMTRKKCASCHYLDRNLRKVGPSLKGIFGKKPSIARVPFEIWDEAALDTWLKDPSKVKPGTQMAIPGMKSAKARKEIINYLKQI
ncbi:MAG: c-type cytochrome [Mariprofundaceae bacterium]